jgi:hypothetical protein
MCFDGFVDLDGMCWACQADCTFRIWVLISLPRLTLIDLHRPQLAPWDDTLPHTRPKDPPSVSSHSYGYRSHGTLTFARSRCEDCSLTASSDELHGMQLLYRDDTLPCPKSGITAADQTLTRC